MTRSIKIGDKQVTLHAAAGALAGPATAADETYGGDISGWSNRHAFSLASLSIDAATGTSITMVNARVVGLDAKNTRWRQIGLLYGGADVVITDKIGFERTLGPVGGSFTRVGVVYDSIAGGTINAYIIPVEETVRP